MTWLQVILVALGSGVVGAYANSSLLAFGVSCLVTAVCLIGERK